MLKSSEPGNEICGRSLWYGRLGNLDWLWRGLVLQLVVAENCQIFVVSRHAITVTIVYRDGVA